MEMLSACSRPSVRSMAFCEDVMGSSSSMFLLIVSIRILRAKIASFAVAALWSWAGAAKLMPMTAAATAPIIRLARRDGREHACVKLTIFHLHWRSESLHLQSDRHHGETRCAGQDSHAPSAKIQ